MFRIVACVARRIAAVRALQACIKALIKVGARLWEKNYLSLVNLIDLA